MSRCHDEQLGLLLHDFELGMLADKDRTRFELHLYDCDYCMDEVRTFVGPARTLMTDSDLRSQIRRLGGEEGNSTKHESPGNSFRFGKFLLAAALIAGIAVPMYWLTQDKEQTASIQHLEFLSARTGGSDVIYLDQGGDVVIEFSVGESNSGPVSLLITNVTGDTVLTRPGFEDFNDRGLGSISLPVTQFSAGHYMLTVTPASVDSTQAEIQYFFRVR